MVAGPMVAVAMPGVDDLVASLDPEQRREISRRGGEASHQHGRAHEWNREEAREAGRRGGRARWEEEAEEGRARPRRRHD